REIMVDSRIVLLVGLREAERPRGEADLDPPAAVRARLPQAPGVLPQLRDRLPGLEQLTLLDDGVRMADVDVLPFSGTVEEAVDGEHPEPADAAHACHLGIADGENRRSRLALEVDAGVGSLSHGALSD